MRDAVCQHLKDTGNVGDLSCCPADYFDFGRTETGNFGDPVPRCRLAIFGGGRTFRQAAHGVVLGSKRAKHRVVWSVGIDRRQAASARFDLLTARSALVSSRMRGVPGCRFVPCVSAMSPLLDDPPAPRHDVVLFLHHERSAGMLRPDGIPSLSNLDVSLERALAHIASGDTVVTNSYHGTFWAMCLGRRVVCVPFSRKFGGFLDPPVRAGPRDWPDALHRARRHGETLEHARHANRAFYRLVMSLE